MHTGSGGTALEGTASRTVARYAMLPDGTVVLAMVSGGADSTALLHLLASGALGRVRLHALHVDHMLRPDSAEDAEWVRVLCERLGIPVRVARFDVAALAAEEGLNVEDAGRRVRYRLAREELDARLHEEATGRIAVAHTLDDSVETALMRLVGGAGMRGLGGIAPVRGAVVRPLIGSRRSEVIDYLRERGVSWREDPTNRDTDRSRAWVRHELVPMLRRRNPRFVESLATSMRVLAEEDAYLDTVARRALERLVPTGSGSDAVVLDAAALADTDPPVARRAVRILLEERFGHERYTAEDLGAVVEGADDPSFARDLTGGLRVRGEYGRIVFSRVGAERESLVPALLHIPGEVDLGVGGSMRATVVTACDVSEDPHVACLDEALVPDVLEIGGPAPGDRIRPLGMSGSKTVADLLTDERIPARLRSLVPVVRCGDEVVWVAGLRMSEDFKVRPDTRRVVRLEHRREG